MRSKIVNGKNVFVITPEFNDSGHTSVQTAAVGANFTAFASQVCSQVTIFNDSGTTIEVKQGANAIPLTADVPVFTFYGITNLNQLSIRRKDQSNTQVTINARWEV